MVFGPVFQKTFRPVFDAGAAEGEFSPSDLSGPIIWIDFSDISTLYQDSAKTTPVASNGDPIGAAVDKFGNGNDVLQAVAADRPTYTTGVKNGLSAAAGANDYLRSAAFTGGIVSQPAYMLAVVQIPVNYTSARYVVDGIDATNRQVMLRTANNVGGNSNKITAYAGAGVYVDTVADSTWYIFTWSINGASSYFTINGSLYGSFNSGALALAGVTLMAYFSAAAGHWPAYFGEFLYYSAIPSEGDQASLISWANAKWAVY